MRFWRKRPKEGLETLTIGPDTPPAPELPSPDAHDTDQEPTPGEELIVALIATASSVLIWLGLDKAAQFTAELAQKWGAEWAYFLLDIAENILSIIPRELLEKPIIGWMPWLLLGAYAGFITTMLEKLQDKEHHSRDVQKTAKGAQRVLRCLIPPLAAVWAGLGVLTASQEPYYQEQMFQMGATVIAATAVATHTVFLRILEWIKEGGPPDYFGFEYKKVDTPINRVLLVTLGETYKMLEQTIKLFRRFETLLVTTATLAAYFVTQTPEISHKLYLLVHDIIMFVSDTLFGFSLICNAMAVVAAVWLYEPFKKLILSKAKEPN